MTFSAVRAGWHWLEELMRRIPSGVWVALKGCVSLGLLIWISTSFEWLASLAALAKLSLLAAATAFLLTVLAQALAALRLQMLLDIQGIRLSYLYTLRLTFVGLFVGNFLPGTVGGDAIKLVLLAAAGHSRGRSAASVVVDRLTNMAAILLLLPVAAASGLFSAGAAHAVWVGLFALLVGGAALIVFLRVRRPSRLDGALNLPDRIADVATQWLNDSRLLIAAPCLSLASVASWSAAVWIAAWNLGIHLGFVPVLAVLITIYCLTLLPISLNGLGVQEVSVVYFLSRLGASPEQAAAAALLTRLLQMGVSLLGLADFLVWKRAQ